MFTQSQVSHSSLDRDVGEFWDTIEMLIDRGRTWENCLIEVIARSGFSFDISFHCAKMDSIDKAKLSVRVGTASHGFLNLVGYLQVAAT